ncbi:hypothetical protein [Pelagibius sp. Alg239-R121]|uniref:hypothetical protein n=1 Tax=Pelagibius sp. Alg239-R121 TaxID=2993448 RepID=UPI002AC3727B|nr:hypothetical protein [Pelagibius sp. Alg239-R121]
MTSSGEKTDIPTWRQPDGAAVSCREKIKVLNENLVEIQEMAQDALEDAILMGCDEQQVREVLTGLMERLDNPYAAKNAQNKEPAKPEDPAE